RFSYIGAFSSGGNSSDFRATFPQLNEASNKQIRRLWIACGKDDFLFEANSKLHKWLEEEKVQHAWLETEGAHTWLVWRRYLATFAPLLWK
ncbi:MAG: esterase, partial [Bryobacter sp.]|nr:esterase [Bryobacter sp.]